MSIEMHVVIRAEVMLKKWAVIDQEGLAPQAILACTTARYEHRAGHVAEVNNEVWRITSVR